MLVTRRQQQGTWVPRPGGQGAAVCASYIET